MPAQVRPEDSLIGLEFGHYRIIEKIGSGGMGVVFRAHDEHLDREVAIKVLTPGTITDEAARKHLRKEALVLSKLNHPNIATVYDFDTQSGVDFLVMEYIPGITLKMKLATGALPEKEVLRLGMQLSQGLAAAHEHGVVHRDLKPGNLRLTSDGRLKILDFGIAKLGQPLTETAETESSLQTHSISGTLPYMAPEQLSGEEVDARTDIHGAGFVLYEMATGQRPFAEVQSGQLIGALMHKPPTPPTMLNPKVSVELERIIGKCVEKDPENRYQSAKELEVDLRGLIAPSTSPAIPTSGSTWASLLKVGLVATGVVVLAGLLVGLNVGGWRDRLFSRARTPRIESLVVLPLINLSDDPQQDYFADGMTEQLTTDLAQIGELRVISRTSAMQYKQTKKTLPQIARELHVDGVVQGSVMRAGDRVRITAQLADAASDQNLWSHSYERDLRDILTLQDEVATAIVRQIQVKLTPQEKTRLESTHPVNMEAYQDYLKGVFYSNKRTAEALKQSHQYFQRAIDEDPNYAPAYAGLAHSYLLLGNYDLLPMTEVIPKAKRAAQKALEIDDKLAEAHSSLGLADLADHLKWADAIKEYELAIELNPNYAKAYEGYVDALWVAGRSEEALQNAKRAQELDPLSLVINTYVGLAYYFLREYDKAIEQHQKTIEMDANFPLSHIFLGMAYAAEKDYVKAIPEARKAVELSGGSSSIVESNLAYIYATAGHRDQALKILAKLSEPSQQKRVTPVAFAVIYAGLGDKDHAFEWLEKAYEEGSLWNIYLLLEPTVDNLRSDSRFSDLLRRVGLLRD